ncbi:hypothetical protein BN946_scf185010.g7 [Trametes cinnabarina]|uniref:Uncharacterized protein n=1 Tax=Pycnoporus cinnabarinus TaxID=5643 RepID=A0A060SKN8_PYCCI|nr:hypothetical protein BN946_scf185010.g7 [Trametes cinnabarina]
MSTSASSFTHVSTAPPTVSFTSGRGMMLVVGDRPQPGPLWQPVHVALAVVAPSLHGLVISGVVARSKGVNVCDADGSMFSIVVQTDTMVIADEHLLNISFIDTSGREDWPEFKLRFNEASVYWSFIQALAEAKRDAHQHKAGIAEALSKVRKTFPQQTDEEQDDDDDLSILGGWNLGSERVQ